ncbi:hypothetical protein K1719_046445 [Acacia pycnantha]|nr:hypothetical protein K1719_046445 [Acacia pycnantha]
MEGGRRITASPRPCCGRRIVAKKRPHQGGGVDGFVNSVKKLQRREIRGVFLGDLQQRQAAVVELVLLAIPSESSSASNFESKLRHLTFQSHLLRSTVKSAKRLFVEPIVCEEKPNDADVFRLLGEVKFEQKDYQGSVAAYKNSMMVAKDINFEVLRGLTNSLLAAKKPDEALRFWVHIGIPFASLGEHKIEFYEVETID